MSPDSRPRCRWCLNDPLNIRYHDEEWGVPLHDDARLFEMLVLETMEAGLSWILILRKRENFRRAFDAFDAAAIAGYDEAKITTLLADTGIIRSRAKIEATIGNARAYLELHAQPGGFDHYIWQFVDHRPITHHWSTLAEVPGATPAAAAMSKALKKRGFKFVGPSVCYAFMQSVGMVNDHLLDCFRHAEVAAG
ncbi:MAG: DNA-3-methyladenine glycosylase I [Anaerolineae bacterium]|nr:DNA-3-methyladenine glycosylase I [Anaerolineae bacterium]